MAFREKTAIVIGVGQSVGRAIGIAFAKENYNVVLADQDYVKTGNVATEINATGGETLGVKCDITKKEEIEDLILKAVSRYKKIDVLINAVEISAPKPFMDITITDWETMMNINLRGALLVSQAMAKEMKDGGGKIIHISSVAANVAWNGMAHYSASKGGLDALMRAMAFELAPKNICVNVISPGVIDCPEQNIVIKNEAIDKMITTNPDKRFGKPEDVAGAALYLASERANHVTGITLVVDGGYTVR